MPNWCYNQMEAHGSEQELKEFCKKVKSKNRLLDFKKIIPYDRKQRIQCKKEWLKRKKENNLSSFYIDDFESYWFNQYGYNWCINTWGTKWGASSVSLQENDGWILFSFDTAWSPPIGIYEKLIELFPNLVFQIYYEEEGCMFAGEVHGEEGVMDVDEYELQGAYCPECKEEGWSTKRDTEPRYVCANCGEEFTEEDAWVDKEELEIPTTPKPQVKEYYF